MDQAFQAVDKQDLSALNSVLAELNENGASIDQLFNSKTEESLLLRAVAQTPANMQIVSLILSSCSVDYIYLALKVCPSLKRYAFTTLASAIELGHILKQRNTK